MLSFRLVALAVVLATVAAVPATDKPIRKPVTTITDDDFDEAPWFSFPLFGNLFSPIWKLFPSFTDIGPKIIADENKFQVVVNVKDYKTKDLKVKVKGDFIFVQGSHEAKQDDHDIFASQFFHTYSLPANSSAADVTAQISNDGFLIVSAPIAGPVDNKDADREVTISESGVAYKEVQQTTHQSTTTPKPEDDRKEPTTPSEREYATEKDNVIPHGKDSRV
jgi:crystallin, alpha B